MKIIFPSLALWMLEIGLACAQGNTVPLANTVLPAPSTQTSPATVEQFRLPEDPATATPASGAPDGAELLVQRVAATVAQNRSIQARVRYQVDLFDQHTIGEGIYLQQGFGDDRQFCLQLKTPVGRQTLTLTQVCDGRYLWQYQQTTEKQPGDASDRPTVTRLDMQRVRLAIEANKHRASTDIAGEMAIGGLPKLMDGLQQSFQFNRANAQKLDVLPVWVVTGSWRPDALAPIAKELSDQAAHGQPLALNKLPAQMPEVVSLFFGQDDLFPYRVEYRRRSAKQGRAGDADRAPMTPIMMVEFFEVRLGAPIDPQQFNYQPANAVVTDNTANYIKSLEGKKPAVPPKGN